MRGQLQWLCIVDPSVRHMQISETKQITKHKQKIVVSLCLTRYVHKLAKQSAAVTQSWHQLVRLQVLIQSMSEWVLVRSQIPFRRCRHVDMDYWWWQHRQLRRGLEYSFAEHDVECRVLSVHPVEMALVASGRRHSHGMSMLWNERKTLHTHSHLQCTCDRLSPISDTNAGTRAGPNLKPDDLDNQ